MIQRIINDNLDNLISLWVLASKHFNTYHSISGFNIAEVKDSQWPNRIWPAERGRMVDFMTLQTIINGSSSALTFTNWEDQTNKFSPNNLALGMRLISTQIGMSLSLSAYSHVPPDLSVVLTVVEDESSIQRWSTIFHQCFGYIISSAVIKALKNNVQYYLISNQNITIGCVSTFVKDNQIGIHSLGILKEFRKKGFAEKVMYKLLDQSLNSGISYAHLQSSPMGRSIYTKLGFKELFQMSNYNKL